MKSIIDTYLDKRMNMPLRCWDIYSQFSLNTVNFINSEVNRETAQLAYFSSKFKWKNNVKDILKSNRYEALVLTDLNKKILWVNDGFSKMTGYDKEFTINKQPVFLQGKNSEEKRISIRKKLAKELPFKEVIINYKKDGTPYNCEIHIFPLKTGKTTHYLALERAI